MNKLAVFGKYYSVSSIIHELDPRTKLLSTLILGILIFASSNYAGLFVVSVFIITIFFLARIPFARGLQSIAPLSFVIVFTALFNLLFVRGGEILVEYGPFVISGNGLHLAIFLGFRLTLLMLTGCLLTLTTTSFDIASATECLLKPFEKIGFPSHEFAFVFSLSLSNVAQLAEEFKIVRLAQITRGAGLPSNKHKQTLAKILSLLVPMLAGVFRHADTLSCAMEARCYNGGALRTKLHPLRFRSSDKVAAFIMLALIGLIIGTNLLF